MNRRDVIQKVILGSTVLIVVPSVLSNCSKDPLSNAGTETLPGAGSGKITIDLSLADNSALNNTGGTKITQGIIVANTGSNNFVALASACTHEGSTIGYSSDETAFICPNHGSKFSTSGSVLLGPATTALKAYPISKSGTILTISL